MVTKVQKWGNSQGLRLSKELLTDAEISVGDSVSVVVSHGTLVITPIRRIRGRHNLKELVASIPEGHQPEEVDWGRPTGREAW